MSYIRCLSNPEGLYVWSGIGGLAITTPNSYSECDENDFIDFCLKWYQYQDDTFEYKNLSYKYENRSGDYKVFLSVGDAEFELWYVTWMYLVHGVILSKLNAYRSLYLED